MPADRGWLETVRRLNDRRERDRLGMYTIERFGAFVRAVDAGVEVVAIVACWKLVTSQVVQTQIRRLRRSGVPTAIVDPPTFRGLCGGARASGVIAVLRQRWTPLRDAPVGAWLALDRIRAPGNLGTIVRTAEAAGLSGIALVGDAIDPFEPAVVGSAMGAHSGLAFVRGSAGEVRAWARARGMPMIGSSPSAALSWDQYAWPADWVLWLGEERQGLAEDVIGSCDASVRIPILGRADSLNVATAAGILVYEAVRQRLRAPSATPPR